LGYPGVRGSHLNRENSSCGNNPAVDPLVLVAIIAVGVPLGIVLALAYAARLRGPTMARESRRPVGSLVTEAVPEEHPDEAEADVERSD
jgi:hypothetical protein